MKYEAGGKQFEETKCTLLDRRAALSREVTTVLRDIGHLEHEVEKISGDISQTGIKLILCHPLIQFLPL